MAHDPDPAGPAVSEDDPSPGYVVATTPGGRIASLDGLRAVAIGAVLLGHLAGSAGFPAIIGDPVRNNGYLDLAYLGVRIFFVISGFLITGILMRESRRPGGISLGRFYLRRTMRIFPAYYAFVATMVALSVAGVVAITSRDVAHALTYTVDYDPDRHWSVGHLWSLAVEEQFYLLWPFVLIAVGLRHARLAALMVIIAAPILRALEYRYIPGWQDIVGNTFETAGDAIAIGCLLALTVDGLGRHRWFQWVIDHPWVIAAAFLASLPLTRWGPTNLLLSSTVANVAVALGVAWVVMRPTSVIGRVLNWRAVMFVGTLSYSIYLWQQLFINRRSDLAVSVFPLDLILVALLALASYYLIERPFLRWRPAVERRLLGGGPVTASAGLEARTAEPGSSG